ncbi:pyridoxamine 5'-phosphate oxidase family protein [Luteibacter sp. dw_328]|uniref:2Fe-2S iron-sulfur cluster-binding protein n=1 Tax=Luteibacter sp. dw_328 TaxID=2719796 RepID=UPI001BD400B0|nr:pyridoxamine 5'-phosphate oxidase family protein [Luteibacter sp. dw_328]
MDTPISPLMPSPWHDGELTLQASVGVVERMKVPGQRQMARDYMPDQHREFYAQLPFVVLGAVDPAGDVWATLRAGKPGFMQSPVPRMLRVTLPRDPNDPADAGMEDGDGIGMLGIELHTRRRNRLNGNVRRIGDDGFEIVPTQSYGNCPQYIQLRDYRFDDTGPGTVAETDLLDDRAKKIISAADSFYVASYVVRDGVRQVDASHRGGKPGFVRIDEDGVLTIPDFSGNLFFNTLGNFLINPRAGLIFVDFHSGDVLQMTGHAEVVLDAPEIAVFLGAERLWRFRPRRVIHRERALPLRWTEIDQGTSPNVAITGSWEDAEARLKAAALAQQWRPFRVEEIVQESASIRSFHLAPDDGAGLPASLPGQHLPVRLRLGGLADPLLRMYTLSSAPGDARLRISVKREGRVSSHLHDHVRVGDLIEARAPSGAFTVDAAVRRPAVFIAAGVGITPVLSMVRHIVREGLRTRHQRPMWVFQSARNKLERAFDNEFAALVREGKGGLRHIRVLGDIDGADEGSDYDAAGRLSVEALKQRLPFDDYDFFLCGPASFMQQMYDGLRGLNVADERIHAEAFGPSGLRRLASPAKTTEERAPVATSSVPVMFMRSGKEARWSPASGSLLELAEQRGLTPEYSCRGGSCGACRTKVISGTVAYAQPTEMTLPAGEALICCAVPAAGSAPLHLDL